jgi:hypothetical protein
MVFRNEQGIRPSYIIVGQCDLPIVDAGRRATEW